MSTARLPRRRVVRGVRNIYFRPLSETDQAPKAPFELKYQDADGIWRFTIATERDGKTVCATLAAAKKALAHLVVNKDEGRGIRITKLTVGEAIDAWIAKPRRGNASLATGSKSNYLTAKRKLPGRFLNSRISDVTKGGLENALHHALDKGNERTGGAIEQSSYKIVYSAVNGAFKDAVRHGAVTFNPMELIEDGLRPGMSGREVDLDNILSKAEIQKLIGACTGWLRVYLLVAIYTGMRQAEVSGLLWRNIDFERGVVRVRKQYTREGGLTDKLKTKKSRRDIELPDELTRELRKWKMDASSPGKGVDDFVFSVDGEPVSHNTIYYAYTKVLGRAGLHHRRLHDLRHTFASILIGEGVGDIKWVSEQMGHSKPSITIDIYYSLWKKEDSRRKHRAAITAAWAA